MQDTTKAYLFVSGVVFGLVALAHFVRAINSWNFVVGPLAIPVSVSWIGFMITAVLCVWAIRLATS